MYATFFMLGTMVAEWPGLTRSVAAAGHEVTVHGWDHCSLALRSPAPTVRHLTRARRLIQAVTGQVLRWWRPPCGVLTVAGFAAARHERLSPVLWSAWGRDWAADATAASVTQPAWRPTCARAERSCSTTGAASAPPNPARPCSKHSGTTGRLEAAGTGGLGR